MDPVSALATATAAFNVLKKGFQIGRDIESMAGDLGRWMSAMSDLSEAEKQAKNPPIFKKLVFSGSVEQEAMQIFAAKKKAEDMRYELKQFIGLSMGSSKWDELVRMEGQIRKDRQETIYKQAQRRRAFLEVVGVILLVGLFSLVVIGLVWFIYAAKNGLL
jgi:hypothetical protein